MAAARSFQALAVSPGIAIGHVMCLHRLVGNRPERRVVAEGEVENELARLADALKRTREQITSLRDALRDRLDRAGTEIFDAHLLLVDDKALNAAFAERIRSRKFCAEFAVFDSVEQFAAVFGEMSDEYLRERAVDLRDVGSRILSNLTDAAPELSFSGRRIVAAPTLAPSDTVQLDRSKVLGLAVEIGSATSHTAILARSLRIPAVVGIPAELLDQLSADDTMIIDGFSGKVIVNPDERTIEAYRLKAKTAGEFLERLERDSALRPETTDGFIVELAANIDAQASYTEAREVGAHGVGLFRTEFMFIDPAKIPGEDEQFEIYKKLLTDAGDDPVTVRTMDIGGDKSFSGVYRAPEENPFLGLRGIRLSLYERPDLFRVQLRALLRAGVYGNLRVMLPMVTSVLEVEETRDFIAKLEEELRGDHIEFAPLSLGVMIETPAAALLADKLAPLVDFFSIGSNDLVQYTMAADRGNERVAYLYRPTHPAILRLIDCCVTAAKHNNIFVGVCGQMAGDPATAALLVGLGVHELSMSPGSVALIRRVIRSLSLHEAARTARAAMECRNAAESMKLVQQLLARRLPELAAL
jgi:phosphotransferase system enzyme I (PtsI)